MSALSVALHRQQNNMPGQSRTKHALAGAVVVFLLLSWQQPLYASDENTSGTDSLSAYELKLSQLKARLQSIEQRDLQNQATITASLNDLQHRESELLKQRVFYQQQQRRLQAETRQQDFVRSAALSQNHKSDAAAQSYFLQVAQHRRASKPLSPLLQKIETLYCAQTPEQAEPLLRSLLGLYVKEQGWPDEALGAQRDSANLYAGSVDIVLNTLYRTLQRFPVLTELSERVALQWNYCPLLGDNGEFYNLYLERDQPLKKKVAQPVAQGWQGFQRWGFVSSEREAVRYVPELLDISVPYAAYEIFLHRIYQQQCFPHPDTGRLYPVNDEEAVLTRTFYPLPTPPAAEQYPLLWHPYCEIPQVEQAGADAWPPGLLRRISGKITGLTQQLENIRQEVEKLRSQQTSRRNAYLAERNQISEQLADIEREQQQLAAQHERERQIQEAERRRQVKFAAEQQRIQEALAAKVRAEQQALAAQKQRAAAAAYEQQRRAQAEQEKRRQQALQQAEAKRRRAAEMAEQQRLEQQNLKQQRLAALKAASEKNKRPVALALPPEQFVPIPDAGGEAYSAPVINSAAKDTDTQDKLNLTTTFIYSAPLDGTKSAGKLNVSWAPADNWFVRGSLKYVNSEELTYTWGVGYSNWRPGTTSIQLNNWGPLKRGDGLAVDKAVLSVSHKIDSETLRENKLSAAVSLSSPLSGDPAANLTFQWSPFKNLYVRTTASQKLEGGPTKWSYGFGYYDWRPNTWRLEYSNYGDNRHPFDNFSAGAITLNRAWQF